MRTVRTIRTKLFCEYTEANSLVDQVWSRSAGGERANPLLNVLRMLAQKSMNVVWIDISPMCDPNISLFHISKTSGFLQSDNKIMLGVVPGFIQVSRGIRIMWPGVQAVWRTPLRPRTGRMYPPRLGGGHNDVRVWTAVSLGDTRETAQNVQVKESPPELNMGPTLSSRLSACN